MLLDDIDTASDAAKDNDAFYRERVEFLQRQRFEIMSGEEVDAIASAVRP